MTEDLKTRTASPPPSESPAPKAPKLDLSVSKVLGGALAAMTAAALGSRLSVAGTLIGAALASIIAAVASAIYTASLNRTKEKVRTVWTGRVAGSGASRDVPTSIEAISEQDQPTTRWAAADPVPGWTVAQPPTPAGGGRPPRRPRGPLNWKGIVVGTLAMFAIAAAALTGFELISGHALSGGSGTTITQVSEPKAKSTPKPSKSASPSPTPSASSSTATPEPSATASSTPEPSSAPSTTTAPTPTPSVTPSASASQATPVPSASATE
jgi:hypothetical protein